MDLRRPTAAYPKILNKLASITGVHVPRKPSPLKDNDRISDLAILPEYERQHYIVTANVVAQIALYIISESRRAGPETAVSAD